MQHIIIGVLVVVAVWLIYKRITRQDPRTCTHDWKYFGTDERNRDGMKCRKCKIVRDSHEVKRYGI